MRDDFSKPTIRVLSERVAGRCSLPICGAQTSGPHTDPHKSVKVGVAGHITAAARGGPRYDPSLTPEQRRHPDNGIWLCQTHGRQVDCDESVYTVDELRAWKAEAEQRATSALGRPAASAAASLEDETRQILAMKTRLKDALPSQPKDMRIIVRATSDRLYPDIDPGASVSGWFRVELWGFYHAGLEVILGIVDGVMDRQGHWSIITANQVYDETRFSAIRMWQLGRIRYADIVDCDADGDEFYMEPHIYCRFAHDGSPIGEVSYRRWQDNLDWPLYAEQRVELGTA